MINCIILFYSTTFSSAIHVIWERYWDSWLVGWSGAKTSFFFIDPPKPNEPYIWFRLLTHLNHWVVVWASMESMFCPRRMYARKYCSLRQDKNWYESLRFSCANVKFMWKILNFKCYFNVELCVASGKRQYRDKMLGSCIRNFMKILIALAWI